MSRSRLRCAIYTRKSSEEGLEQDFNSLDAQREACAAYITSQKHEGWSMEKARYDDGGVSGGTMERPALRRLLADISEGRIDVVVVYKVDRLTRSLSDFARIVDIFDAGGVSFVSVTQQFNTTSSMGRLTLNVLLSFAQFEREVTAERIRDKIAASKKKGMWMGGNVPLGYDAKERKLVINETEAVVVRRLFDLYLHHGSVQRVSEEAQHLGLRTKPRTRKYNDRQGGEPFQRGHLYKLLSNPVYVGEITHKGERYPGEHPAIIDRTTWDTVQEQLARNAVTRRHHCNGTQTSLLAGLLYDTDGVRLTPSHATKQGRRYRYYTSPSEVGHTGWRLPGPTIETTVIDLMADLLRDTQWLMDKVILVARPAADLEWALVRAADLGRVFHKAGPADQRELLVDLVERIAVAEDRIQITVRACRLLARLGIDASSCEQPAKCSPPYTTVVIEHAVTFRRRGVETRIVIPGREKTLAPDAKLIALITQGHRWFAELRDNRAESVRDLARRHGADQGDVSRVLPLAFLAPDIVEAIIAGQQPVELTVTALRRGPDLPASWAAQRRMLGFA